MNPKHPYIITRSQLSAMGSYSHEYHLYTIKDNIVREHQLNNHEAIEFIKSNKLPKLFQSIDGVIYGDEEFKEKCPRDFVLSLT